MAINFEFFTFSKKKNSTLLPSVSGNIYTGVIKEPSSIMNPTLVLDAGSSIRYYNYVHITTFNRYYFIDDLVSDHGRWIVSCTCDVLGSFRSSILNSTQYILRCSTEGDSNIIDHMYPVTNEVSFRKTDIATRPVGNTLRYIIGIANANSDNTVGGCTYYSLPYGEFTNLMGMLLGSSSYLGNFSSDGISESLVKALVNPLSYIGETYILPYDISDGTQSLLNCGWWPVDNTYGYDVLTNNVILSKHQLWNNNGSPISFPLHPQTAEAGSFVNCAPYTRITLYAGPFGYIQLDPTIIHNAQRVDFVVNGDFKGNIELEIWGWQTVNNTLTKFLIDKRDTNCAIPISLTQANNDLTGLIGLGHAAVNAGISAASGNPAGLCSDIAAGLDSAQDYFLPKSEGRPSVGTFDDILEDWSIFCEFRHITDTESGIFGKPLCTAKKINTLQGTPYILCKNAHIGISGTLQEANQIEAYLDSGVYIDS